MLCAIVFQIRNTIKLSPTLWSSLSVTSSSLPLSALVPDALFYGSDRARGPSVVVCNAGAILESGRERRTKLGRVTVPCSGRLKPPCPSQLSPLCVCVSDGYPCHVIR